MSGGDIERTTFDEVKRGWDPDQVREFLAAVGARVTELEAEVESAGEMRAAALELVAQAEALVDQVQERSAGAASGEFDVAETLAAAERQAAEVRSAAEQEAARLIEAAREQAAASGADVFASMAGDLEDLRREAELTVHMARVEAAGIVERARESAGVRSGSGRTADGAQDEVDAIVAEAEALLEEARTKAGAIMADATARAEHLWARSDLSAEIHRAIVAVKAVAEARTRRTGRDAGDSGGAEGLSSIRSRAAGMLGELRSVEGKLPPGARADMLDELVEVQDIVRRVEARLIGHPEEDEMGDDAIVVDLTNASPPADEAPSASRPSRYQQRSANLPKIGKDVDDVSRAIRSIREQLKPGDQE